MCINWHNNINKFYINNGIIIKDEFSSKYKLAGILLLSLEVYVQGPFLSCILYAQKNYNKFQYSGHAHQLNYSVAFGLGKKNFMLTEYIFLITKYVLSDFVELWSSSIGALLISCVFVTFFLNKD